MKLNMKYKKNEQGFASIVVALTIIIVLGLLSVGFSQLARREQQSALDKQLSTQAYYAAETGINDTKKYLNDPLTLPNLTNLNTEQCITGSVISTQNDLPGNSGASYNCVIANTRPLSLEYKEVPAGTSKVVNFKAVDIAGNPVALNTLKIEWESAGSVAPSGPAKAFEPNASWNHKSVIQFSLTPYLDVATTNHNTLVSNTTTNYLYPNADSNNTVDYQAALANQGVIKDGACDSTTNKCFVIISNIAGQAADNYLIHFINMYKQSNIVITGTSATGPIKFEGGQAMIDVTGKARNVLKRLRVRVPLNPRADIPGYSIEARNICKRIETAPNKTEFIAAPTGALPDTPCALDQ